MELVLEKTLNLYPSLFIPTLVYKILLAVLNWTTITIRTFKKNWRMQMLTVNSRHHKCFNKILTFLSENLFLHERRLPLNWRKQQHFSNKTTSRKYRMSVSQHEWKIEIFHSKAHINVSVLWCHWHMVECQTEPQEAAQHTHTPGTLKLETPWS